MSFFRNFLDVLVIFLIPFGGGIPGGVLLAKNRGIDWPGTMGIYLVSDIILALAFEPIMILFIRLGKKIDIFARIGALMKNMILKTLEHYGNKTGVLALVMIAFGVDPMTGRGVAAAAGHGFITGWMIAITGDMIYFTMLMVSTLWLNNITGNGTLTILIILALMIAFPSIQRKIQKKIQK